MTHSVTRLLRWLHAYGCARRFLFVMSLVGLVLAACNKGSSNKTDESSASEPANTGKLKIAVIPKGTTHEFWKSVHAGAVKAERELGVQVIWKGPLKEDDLKSQIDLVQSFTAQGVSGIALAPLNDKALVSAVKSATRSQIPVVIFDSDLKGNAHTSFVATDNFQAGKLAGEAMGKALDGKGNVVVLRYQEGSASTRNREQGFLEAIKKHPGIRVLSDNQYGGATTESAFSASESLLLAKNAAKGEVDGIFTPNESTTFGMLLALQKAGLASKIHFIGFDASDKLVQGLEQGQIDGLVLQDPFNMGYLAVKTMALHLQGKPVEKRIDTGSTLATQKNRSKPRVAQLLEPQIEKWLGEGAEH